MDHNLEYDFSNMETLEGFALSEATAIIMFDDDGDWYVDQFERTWSTWNGSKWLDNYVINDAGVPENKSIWFRGTEAKHRSVMNKHSDFFTIMESAFIAQFTKDIENEIDKYFTENGGGKGSFNDSTLNHNQQGV